MPNPAFDPIPGDPIARLTQRLAYLESLVEDLARSRFSNNPNNQQAWINASLVSPWTTGTRTASGEAVPQYFRDPSGNVHFQGTARHTTFPGGTVAMFTLPAGFAPSARQTPIAFMSNSAGVTGVGFITITSGGVVSLTAGADNYDDVILDNIH